MSSRTMKTKPASSARRTVLSRPFLIIVAVIALVVLVTGLAVVSNRNSTPYVPEVTDAPHAVVSTTLIDHGDMQMEEFAESTFHIRNTGDQPLLILEEPRVELVQGCCPPRALVSRMILQPGEETTISLHFTMHNMMGGAHEFRVHVLTNDPTQAVIPLTILSNWIE